MSYFNKFYNLSSLHLLKDTCRAPGFSCISGMVQVVDTILHASCIDLSHTSCDSVTQTYNLNKCDCIN